MQRAVPVGEGAMAALIGPKSDVALAETAAPRPAPKSGVCAVANDNNAGNVVISGGAAAVVLRVRSRRPRSSALGRSR